MEIYEHLVQRGLIEKATSEDLAKTLNQGKFTFYVGFDPTANSLHVGQLAVFNVMKFLQQAGNKPIGLMGGATGMIGDPGGKNKERNLLNAEQINENISGIKNQMQKFLDFSDNKASLVNNYDWLSGFGYIEFLRDVGKNFSVNQMITRDSVKSRLEREGSGISYTEFSYMLLQAYDFQYLAKEMNCTLQVGGSDQWGNIVSGIDLARRMDQKQLYGLTIPLITKSDGAKFGKSESGTIWLSPEKTSPFDFYQYFVRQTDEDVIYLLKTLTQVSLEEISELEEAVKNEAHLRKAQKKLAEELTIIVHSKAELEKVLKASKVLYGEPIENLDDEMISSIFKDVPCLEKKKESLSAGWSIIDALVETEACKSKGQARKLLQGGGVYLNNLKQDNVELSLGTSHLASSNHMILRTGKKNYRLVRFV